VSDVPHHELDIREQIVRIDRMIEETQKFREETRKISRERTLALAPWQVVVTAMGTGGALVAATVALMKVLGG
jgi:hypothetical protein